MATELTLKSLKNVRKNLKSQLTRFKKYVHEFNLQNTEFTIPKLQLRLEKIENSLTEFTSIQTKIENILIQQSEDGNISEESHWETFENDYYDIVGYARQIISNALDAERAESGGNDSLASEVQSATQVTQAIHQTALERQTSALQIKYPQINLPIFHGAYDEWLNFYDTFNSLIHNNKALSDIEKFHYLKSCLRNDAAQIIKSLEVSSLNYAIAWNLLKDRFQNKRLIINNHMKGLHEIAAINKESATGLRQLVDNTVTHLRALDSLGEPTHNWDTPISFLLTNKLDPSTRRSWETSIQKDQIPTLQDLLHFLAHRAQMLESIYGCQSKESNKQNKDHSNKYRTHASYYANFKPTCPNCKNAHFIYQCEDFIKLTIPDRVKKVNNLKLCSNCLKLNHSAEECKSNSTCKQCGNNHNTLLHPTATATNTTNTTASSLSCQQVTRQILLSTATVFIQDKKGKQHKCRALLDSGSHINFITNDLCEKLQLQKASISQTVTGINQESIQIGKQVNATIKSRFNAYSAKLGFLILPKITENLPPQNIDASHWNIPDTIKLADEKYNLATPIDILIGAEIFWSLFCVGQISLGKNMPVLQKTKLGWILAGPIGSQLQNKLTCHFSQLSTLNSKVEQFWEVENQGLKNTTHFLSPEEQLCEKHFVENTAKSSDGKFVVRLPLKTKREQLGDSKDTALKRFTSLEKRLEKAPEVKQQYHQFMQEYISLGHMQEVITDNEEHKTCYYLPHHAVVKEDSVTTKLRVVFDGSAKSESGLSLNDIMMIGPTVQPDLFTILSRFRIHKIALTADVEKMYRMVKVHKDDVDLQRILWRFTSNEPIKSYNLLTVTYGTAAASYLSTRCLQKVAEETASYNEADSKIIKESFYVDDLLVGFDSVDKALRMQNDLQDILEKYGFYLRKWCSNSTTLTQNLSSSKDEHHVIDLNKQESIKTLGLVWNPTQDVFQYTVKDNIKKITKRSILSNIASVFDPLGLLEPVTITAKIILQQVWQERLDWDEVLPMNLHTMWERYKRGIHVINELKIDRCVISVASNDYQIHGFADASERAYGACIYLRSQNTANLLCSKSRVAPLKQTTIPRLELCAADLLARLYAKISQVLKIGYTTYLWTDSTIVLAWLKGSPSQWQTFVANRVSHIQELTNVSDWRHVRTHENPADMLSRGIPPQEIQHATLWWHGPQWLQGQIKTWPIYEEEMSRMPIPEQRMKAVQTFVANTDNSLFNKYSKLVKLQRVTAYILRFINNSKNPQERNVSFLTVDELKNSLNVLLKISQRECFPREFKKLSNKKPLTGESKLMPLNPFISSDGLMRLGGRLKHANLDYDNKYPIILDPNHALTKLIIAEEHNQLMHAGCQATLASLRTRYWPLSGRRAVQKALQNCITCFKAKPRQTEYLMGDLPEQRVTPTRPFLTCGVDYAGPLFIKEGGYRSRKVVKTYLCIFVCLSTKAIHLELARDLTSEAFLNCFRRFISRRGKCHTILSDNGTNFVGAKNKLKELGELLTNNEETISRELSKQFIQWNMIPPRSPHFGGLWEAAVKSAKYHLTRVVGITYLTYEELYTVLVQIEGCLNSRPISPLSNDPSDLNPLTPGHFLVGDSLQTIQQPNCHTDNLNLMNRYERQQQLVKNFWDRWHKDYLQTLQQRPKWNRHQLSNLKMGSLVILREDNMPPLKWQLGRITGLHPGSDGVTRVVTVKVGDSEIKRPVKKVCVLPFEQ